MKKNTLKYLILFCALGSFACAGKQPPISAMTKAEVAVTRAEQTKVSEAAPLEMRLAREKLDQAKKDMDKKDYDSARRNAESAAVQAELAESKAKLTDTKTKTQDAKEGLKTLENEVQHSDERGVK